MRKLLRIVSWAALVLGIVLPPILFFSGSLGPEGMSTAMTVGTVTWFLTAPTWMRHEASH